MSQKSNTVGDQTSEKPSQLAFSFSWEHFLAPPLKFTKVSKKLDSAWGNRKNTNDLNRLQLIKTVLKEASNNSFTEATMSWMEKDKKNL